MFLDPEKQVCAECIGHPDRRRCTKCEQEFDVSDMGRPSGRKAIEAGHYLSYCQMCLRLQLLAARLRRKGIEVPEHGILLQLELSARIPCDVLKPHVEQLLKEAATYLGGVGGVVKYAGSSVIEQWTGVDQRYIYAIMENDRIGIPVAVADQLSLRSSFTMNQLLDECREWAKRNHNSWPVGWHERDNGASLQRRRRAS